MLDIEWKSQVIKKKTHYLIRLITSLISHIWLSL